MGLALCATVSLVYVVVGGDCAGGCAPLLVTLLVGHIQWVYLWWSVWNAWLRISRGMWCLRHAGALAWRRGAVCACTHMCCCCRIFTYIHACPHRPDGGRCLPGINIHIGSSVCVYEGLGLGLTRLCAA